jgi:hypothetical protein
MDPGSGKLWHFTLKFMAIFKDRYVFQIPKIHGQFQRFFTKRGLRPGEPLPPPPDLAAYECGNKMFFKVIIKILHLNPCFMIIH